MYYSCSFLFFQFSFLSNLTKIKNYSPRLRCFGSSANSIKFEFEENFCLHHLSVFHRRLNSKNVHNDRFFYARVNSQAIVFKGISLINIFSNFLSKSDLTFKDNFSIFFHSIFILIKSNLYLK